MLAVVERSSEISALILIFTTCAVLLYFIFLLTSIFNGDREVKTILKIGQEEVVIEGQSGKQFLRFKFHKFFWIVVGISYMAAFLTMFWFIILVLVFIFFSGKLVVKKAKA
jgi:hypothetical protein